MPDDDTDTDAGAEADAEGDAGADAAADVLDVDGDAVAGVVDVFGALTRDELERALRELAFKRQRDVPDGVVDDAVASYHLVEHDDRLFVGPAAFPDLPDGAEDLPHILDVDARAVDRDAVARTAEQQFRTDTAQAVAASDDERIEHLLDVSYDLETWGPVELRELRGRLDDALDDALDDGLDDAPDDSEHD